MKVLIPLSEDMPTVIGMHLVAVHMIWRLSYALAALVTRRRRR